MPLPLTLENKKELSEVASLLVIDGRGILAIDESPKSIQKKFDAVGIENTEENRRRYREMLLTAPKEIGKYLGGVILNEETFGQKTSEGTSFIEVIREAGIIPGVKLDKGLSKFMDEQVSIGLEDLDERCQRYKQIGAGFAKWRSVFTIGEKQPTEECIYKNCAVLSEYAMVCQRNGLVPVVEPEVLFTGAHHSEECARVTSSVISCLFYHLNRSGVFPEGMLLKTGFVTPGSEGKKNTISEVAHDTIAAFRRSVPPAVPGIVFLSGGHPEEVSVEYLKNVNTIGADTPWILSFSFGRALQDSVLALWRNSDEKKEEAQKHLVKRARICSEATNRGGVPEPPETPEREK